MCVWEREGEGEGEGKRERVRKHAYLILGANSEVDLGCWPVKICVEGGEMSNIIKELSIFSFNRNNEY